MNPSSTKTNQKHQPFRRCSEFIELDGAEEKATGFCGENHVFNIVTHIAKVTPLFSFASVLKDGK